MQKRKSILVLNIILLMMVLMTGCTAQKKESTIKDAEIALITSFSTVEDHSYNQSLWEGVKEYGDEHGITYQYYVPKNATSESYLEAIGIAIRHGAKIVVCSGFIYEEPVYLAQDIYPEQKFILIDGEPHTADYSVYETKENVLPIMFKEEESGFLAGYCAVKEGNTNLGFIGGMSIPPVVRYGYGYLQGIDYAAREAGIEVNVRYGYAETYEPTKTVESIAAKWYQEGTQTIFACGGNLITAVIKSAKTGKNTVIGVDVDQAYLSDCVITSATKHLTDAVEKAIASCYDGTFQGGKTKILGAENDGVGLPMTNSRLNNFKQSDYDMLYTEIVEGNIEISNETDPIDASSLELTNTKVEYISLGDLDE
ncbi:MAG: BMP family ABC transporter substrate-binding protein [Clostridia bacterium]|nr:BMP family ABC transporter substrate-binding protein [Clostridia bacterium]